MGDGKDGYVSGEYVENNYFLRFWEQSKQKIYKAFGEKLILKKRISSIIEDDEKSINNVIKLSEKMQLAFGKICKIGTVHGRLNPEEKNKISNL